MREIVKTKKVVVQKQYDKTLCKNKQVPLTDITLSINNSSSSRKRRAPRTFGVNQARKVRRTDSVSYVSGQCTGDESVYSEENSVRSDIENDDRSYHIDGTISEERKMTHTREVSSATDDDNVHNRNQNHNGHHGNVNTETDSDLEHAREECSSYMAQRRNRRPCTEYEKNRNIVEDLGYV